MKVKFAALVCPLLDTKLHCSIFFNFLPEVLIQVITAKFGNNREQKPQMIVFLLTLMESQIKCFELGLSYINFA